jgi:tetratricopeptide (TPR) repeat protein
LLSEGVHRALADRGICEALGETEVKGLDGPVRVWRLCGLSSEPTSANRSAFVGRAAELEQFKAMLAATIARRSGQILYVRGEAGIGKTRLVEEMRRLAEANGFIAHRGLVLDFGVGKGQDPIRALLLSLLGLSPAASGTEARQRKVEDLISEKVVSPERLAFLRDLLDLPQTSEWRTLYDAMDNAARNRGRRAVTAALVAHACGREPTFVLVEDLHWADPQLLGHLAAFASAMADGPGLLIMTSRIEGDPIDAAWRASCRGTPFATIDLGPLRRDEALSLAGGFMDATQRVAIACIERAGGNPLFLEQLLRNAEEGTSDAVPPSIQSLVLARLDRLTASDRYAFQAAAVIGQRFDLTLLRHLIDAPDYVCDGLISNALVLPEGDDFLFAHAQPRAELLGETMGVFACYELADYDAMKAYQERGMRLARQLGARRFEAQGLEMEARMLLGTGRRTEAAAMLREALAMCRDAGTQFCGPKVTSALSRAVDDAAERAALLAEGKAMLAHGAVGHNHLWFYRDAIEALLSAGDAAGALEYVEALEHYARAEPLPWSDVFAARGRALAAARHGGVNAAVRSELVRVRTALENAGFAAFLPAVDAALAE